jgi:hypothetical protein
MGDHERRWSWFGQATDAALLLAGLALISTMIWRNTYPLNGILLVAFCAGGLSSGQLASLLRGWKANGNGKPPSSS